MNYLNISKTKLKFKKNIFKGLTHQIIHVQLRIQNSLATDVYNYPKVLNLKEIEMLVIPYKARKLRSLI